MCSSGTDVKKVTRSEYIFVFDESCQRSCIAFHQWTNKACLLSALKEIFALKLRPYILGTYNQNRTCQAIAKVYCMVIN